VNKFWIFWTDFLKAPLPNFMKIRAMGATLIYADGQTDGHDEANRRLSWLHEGA